MQRLLLILVSAFLALAVWGCAQPASAATPASVPAVEFVRADGSYPTVPLEKDEVVIKVIQSGVSNLQDFDTVAEGLESNLSSMTAFAKRACSEGRKPDFLLYNEFPLTGYSFGTREEKLQFTIEVPGPETKRLGELAKECDTYIIFGSYARDSEWPGHILSINTVIGRDGEVAEKFWKTRNIKRLGAEGEIPTTTIENVRDKYRALYGIEAEFPVLRTEYGNIAVSTVQLDPFVFAAFAMRGVEIMFRTATLFSVEDVKATARFHNFYSAMSNITFPVGSGAEAMGGNSLIVSPSAEVLGELPGNDDGIIEGVVPIAAFREGRRIPRYPMEVVEPVFSQYIDEVPLNHLDLPPDELPQTRDDMRDLIDQASRWLNP